MVPKPVILVSSCKRDAENGANSVIRDTWARRVPKIPVFFFLGRGCRARYENDVLLDAPDDYFGLTPKTQLSLQWAIDRGYTNAFRAFTDTFIDVDRLEASGYQEWEYTGNLSEWYEGGFNFCHGGPGYWLGSVAMPIAAHARMWQERWEWHKWEDQFVGHTLYRAGIRAADDKRYSMGTSYEKAENVCLANNDVISEHLSAYTGMYDKDWMLQAYNRRLGIAYQPQVPKGVGCMCQHCRAQTLKKVESAVALTTRSRDVRPPGLFRPPAAGR
jgi:hypothetical protein